MSITYRTEKGSPLTNDEIDNNFRFLSDQITFLNNGQIAGVEGIANVEQVGNQITFVGTQGSRFTVEISGGLQFVGDWASNTFYYQGDVVLLDGSSYVVVRPHLSSDFQEDVDADRLMTLALKGSQGENGTNGVDGQDGQDGARFYYTYDIENFDVVANGFRELVDILVDANTGDVYEYDNGTFNLLANLKFGYDATEISFDPQLTTLTATTVAAAIAELDEKVETLETGGSITGIDGGLFS